MDDCRHGQQKRTCEICELEAERDRLRKVVDADDGWAGVITKILLTIDGGRREWSHPVGEQIVAAVAELKADRDRLRAVVVATATDARVLVKALGQRNTDAATALAERIYDRHEPYDVGEQLDGSADGTDG